MPQVGKHTYQICNQNCPLWEIYKKKSDIFMAVPNCPQGCCSNYNEIKLGPNVFLIIIDCKRTDAPRRWAPMDFEMPLHDRKEGEISINKLEIVNLVAETVLKFYYFSRPHCVRIKFI